MRQVGAIRPAGSSLRDRAGSRVQVGAIRPAGALKSARSDRGCKLARSGRRVQVGAIGPAGASRRDQASGCKSAGSSWRVQVGAIRPVGASRRRVQVQHEPRAGFAPSRDVARDQRIRSSASYNRSHARRSTYLSIAPAAADHDSVPRIHADAELAVAMIAARLPDRIH